MRTLFCILDVIMLTLLVVFALFYHGAKELHTPRLALTANEVMLIRKYGLIHFTRRENVEDILKKGVMPHPQNALFRREKEMVWFYIVAPYLFEQQAEKIHKKGSRSEYDACVIIRELSEGDMKNLRIRKKDGAVVHIGTLKTNNMKGMFLD